MPKPFTLLPVVSSLQSKPSSKSQMPAADFKSLLQSESEDTLQMAVTQVFREFGPVFVKIRRDNKQMPFAFCQYTVSVRILIARTY